MNASPDRARTRKKGDPGEVGKVLRDVYEKTVREPVPPEFLDLLGRLD
ncbi:MAG: NepR family anti-sigma factor [Sphingosinicella sp.]